MKSKIAIVHDALVNTGGAERVVGIFHELFPDAPIFTSVYHAKNTYLLFKDVDIRTTWVQNIAFNETAVRLMMNLCLKGMKSFDLKKYDIILSSASWCAKNISPRQDALHICYCYAPFRLLWNTDDYLINDGIIPDITSHFLAGMRRGDFEAAQRVDYFLTSCKNTAKKIKDCYNRDSTIIYPPVDAKRFKISADIGNYFLVVSRMVPYKRIDIAVEAFGELGYPLKIVGEGPQRKRLQRIAKRNIQFLGRVPDKDMADLYSKALALVHTADEDYGIVPLEAQASGRPVIAYSAGGVLETVVPVNGSPGRNYATGILFPEQDKRSLIETILKFKPSDFKPESIREHAKDFDVEIFKDKIMNFITQKANG